MQLRKNSDTTQTLPTEIFDVLVGFKEEEKIEQKKRASQRSLAARRAIERHQEEKVLAHDIDDEFWFDDI